MENDEMELQVIPEKNNTGYEATVKEMALLETLLNPEHRMKSITDICKIASCSRTCYYESFAKPEFRALYELKVKDLVKQAIAPVLNTFIKEALRGSFQHGKVILEMAGLYNEKSTVEVTGEIALSTPEERRAYIADLLKRPLLDGVQVPYQVTDKEDLSR